MKVVITSPSLDVNYNVSGISSVVRLIVNTNPGLHYVHFEIGRRDNEKGRFPMIKRVLGMYVNWLHLLVQQKDILVHFNTALCRLSAVRDFPMILITRILRRRIVVHLHGGDFLTDKNPPFWMRNLIRLSLSGNIKVIVLSAVEEAVVTKIYRCKKIFVLPNCVDLSDAVSFDCPVRGNPITMLFLGRISADKGLEYLYNAISSLKSRGVKLRFVMAGRGPDEEVYRTKFEKLLGESFEFPGVVYGVGKTELLKRCNIFILPSFYEGLPMALLESMSFGLVPVATDVGSIKTVITDGLNGILIKSHSSSEIEAAVLKLSGDERYLNSLSENARKYIFKNFRSELYIEKLNSIYSGSK